VSILSRTVGREFRLGRETLEARRPHLCDSRAMRNFANVSVARVERWLRNGSASPRFVRGLWVSIADW
jgi:hypothetical protein